VKLAVTFSFPRPKSHYRSDGVTLKPSAPYYKTSAPDLDKLQRAIGDALTGTVFRDDALVAVWEVRKVYDETTYANIAIIDLSGGQDHDAGRVDAAGEGQGAGGSSNDGALALHQGG
jgi:Holliday junction resolvase RusA-like endonuclease